MRIWRVVPDAAGDVIDAATQCLVDGTDTPTLRELAGVSPKESWYVVNPLIEATMDELGMARLLEGDPQRAALEAKVRLFKGGRVTARELASWVAIHIGFEGIFEAGVFVELFDLYDETDYLNVTAEELDRWVAEEADALLNGLPSLAAAHLGAA